MLETECEIVACSTAPGPACAESVDVEDGEALDGGDKATAKAISAAYKHVMVRAFCIPAQGMEDGDASTHRLKPNCEQPDPVQGWEQWFQDLQDTVRICETAQALDRVQDTYRAMLRTASKRRSDAYGAVGKAVSERRQAPSSPQPALAPGKRAGASTAQKHLAHA